MVTNDLPGVRVSSRFVVPVALSLAGIILFLGRLAMKAQRLKPVSGVRVSRESVGERSRPSARISSDRSMCTVRSGVRRAPA